MGNKAGRPPKLIMDIDLSDYERALFKEGMKLTPERMNKLLTYIKDGNYLSVAAEASGISQDTFYRWINRGIEDKKRGDITPYAVLAQRVKQAHATAEADMVSEIRHSDKLKTPLCWILERTRGPKYKQNEPVQVTNQVNLIGVNAPPELPTDYKSWLNRRLETERAIPHHPHNIQYVNSCADGQGSDVQDAEYVEEEGS